MKQYLLWLSMFSMLVIACSRPNADWLKMVETEKEFAGRSVSHGVPEAFTVFFSEEAVMFRFAPMYARPVYQNRKATPGVVLDWAPTFAEISAAGDLGYTYGPFELSKTDSSGKKTSNGYFISVWKKQPDGNWRVAFDNGISYNEAVLVRDQTEMGPMTKATSADTSVERKKLLARDQAFSTDTQTHGVDAAAGYFSDRVRLFRDNVAPQIGKNAALAQWRTDGKRGEWTAMFAGISGSADFGYTWGVGKRHADQDGKESYARFWRREGNGEWQVVLDVSLVWPQ